MEYGAPKEIRTPDPQNRSLARSENRLRKSIACTAIVFCAAANPAISQDKAEWNPPQKYDHQYHGRLTLHRGPQPQVVAMCQYLIGARGLTVSDTQRGCAWVEAGACTVIAIDEPYRGTSPEAVLRHEIGHCNGWPANHPEE